MLPPELRGPGLIVHVADPSTFVDANLKRYPHLDRDFLTQICWEHPDRFDRVLPGFDPAIHKAARTPQRASWILRNVTYDESESLRDLWAWHVDRHLEQGRGASEVLVPMLANQSWPFPPVVVEASFARSLGASTDVGEPFYLIEGTHRVSYLHRLVELGRIPPQSKLELIMIAPLGD